MRKRKCPREPDRQGPAYRPPFARLDGRSPRCGALLDTRLRWLAGSAWAVSRTRGLASGNIDALVHGRALHSSATIANAKPAKQGRAPAGNGLVHHMRLNRIARLRARNSHTVGWGSGRRKSRQFLENYWLSRSHHCWGCPPHCRRSRLSPLYRLRQLLAPARMVMTVPQLGGCDWSACATGEANATQGDCQRN